MNAPRRTKSTTSHHSTALLAALLTVWITPTSLKPRVGLDCPPITRPRLSDKAKTPQKTWTLRGQGHGLMPIESSHRVKLPRGRSRDGPQPPTDTTAIYHTNYEHAHAFFSVEISFKGIPPRRSVHQGMRTARDQNRTRNVGKSRRIGQVCSGRRSAVVAASLASPHVCSKFLMSPSIIRFRSRFSDVVHHIGDRRNL